MTHTFHLQVHLEALVYSLPTPFAFAPPMTLALLHKSSRLAQAIPIPKTITSTTVVVLSHNVLKLQYLIGIRCSVVFTYGEKTIFPALLKLVIYYYYYIYRAVSHP
jgi:hypothetical protein